MNAKHYISLEAAKMLKEKGYNEDCDYCFYYDDYHDKWDFDLPYNLFDDEPMYYNNETIDDEMYSMPTLLEAIDWLEERGIRIVIRLKIHDIDCKEINYWYYEVLTSIYANPIREFGGLMHTDRNECMQKAIEKALELL